MEIEILGLDENVHKILGLKFHVNLHKRGQKFEEKILKDFKSNSV